MRSTSTRSTSGNTPTPKADLVEVTCGVERALEVGITSFADAVAALDTPKGDDISDRVDLTIDGHPAARWDVTRMTTCPGFGLWSGTLLGAGETGSIYVIDVDGVLVEVELNRNGRQTSAELEEAWALIASLQFE